VLPAEEASVVLVVPTQAPACKRDDRVEVRRGRSTER
jgi:hypothetical protein